MQVAIDLNDSRLGKQYGAGLPLVVTAEVEALRLGERKDVVEDGVHVGKRHTGPGRNNCNVGRKTAVALFNLDWLDRLPRGRVGLWSDRSFEVDDYTRLLVSQRILFGVFSQRYRGAALIYGHIGGNFLVGELPLNENGARDALRLRASGKCGERDENSELLPWHASNAIELLHSCACGNRGMRQFEV